MRSAAVLLTIGLTTFLGYVAAGQSSEVFSLGVTPSFVAADLTPGEVVCQRNVLPPLGATDELVTAVRTTARAPGRMDTVLEVHIGSAIGKAVAPAADTAPEVQARLNRGVVFAGRRSVCIKNAGPARLQILGNADIAARVSAAELGDGKPLGNDLALVFEGEPRSWLTRAPTLARRASFWRAEWVSQWTFLVIGIVLVGVIPALVVASLAQSRPQPPLNRQDGAVPRPVADPGEPGGGAP